jgi:predicted GNAT family N-acyltransferase
MPETILVIKTSKNQRKKFDCSIHPLNDYLRRNAETNDLHGIGKTFVLVINEEIIGYYTVSMSQTVEFQSIINEDIEKWPKYPIPVALIGRLAVSKQHQRSGWGKWLLTDALHKIYKASENVGAHAVIVDAKDESAKSFYLQYGFIPFPNKPLTLYMSLKSIAELIK